MKLPWIVEVCASHARQGPVRVSREQVAAWEAARNKVLRLFDERTTGALPGQREALANDLYNVSMIEDLAHMSDDELVEWLQGGVDACLGVWADEGGEA